MSSVLPQLRAQRSPLTASLPSIYQVYPAMLPHAPDIPQRVNPAFPPPPKRRHAGMETTDGHWSNYQRSARMKQREHYRYHNAWGKYYYGNAAEQEEHRANIRAVLKQQMSDLDRQMSERQKTRFMESKSAVLADQKDKQDDLNKFHKHFIHMRSYTQDNKTMMENKWDKERERKRSTDIFDREQLRYNPINWSCTLK